MKVGVMTGIEARGVNMKGGEGGAGNGAASAQLSLSADRAAATRDPHPNPRCDSRAASRMCVLPRRL